MCKCMYKILIYMVILIFLSIRPVMAKEVVGWIENVQFYPDGITLKAKIDTGAKTSSLHYNHMNQIEKDGEIWVSFSITNANGETQYFKKKVVRTSTIKRHFGAKQDRLVIKMGLCLGGIYKEADVNLVDRSGLNYQLLIGRRFLKEAFLVDPGNQFLSNPNCQKQ